MLWVWVPLDIPTKDISRKSCGIFHAGTRMAVAQVQEVDGGGALAADPRLS
jgi:hypothetical protein